MHKKLVLIFLILATLPALAQHHIFKSAGLPLPSPESYRILQDRRGFVWIATEQGLCRFDGQNVKVYGAAEGMNEKAVYALREDKEGTIWLLTRKGKVLNIRNDKVVDSGFKKYLGDVNMSNIGYDFFFEKDSILIPIGYGAAACLNKKDKSVTKIKHNRLTDYFIHIEHKYGQVVPLIMSFSSDIQANTINIQYTDKDEPDRSREIIFPVYRSIAPQVITSKLKNRVFFSIFSQLIEIGEKGELKIHDLPNRILSMLPDSKGGLWVGIMGYGVHYYENGDFSKPSVKSLPGLSVSNIMEDREKHIWCTTLEKGVYICQQPGMLAFDNFNGLHRRLDVLSAEKEEFIISSKHNEIIVIDSILQPRRLFLSGTSGELIMTIRRFEKEWFVGYKEMLKSGIEKKNSIILKKRTDHLRLNGLQFADWSGFTYELSYRDIFRYDNGKLKLVASDFSQAVRSFLVLDSSKFLVAMPEEIRLITVQNGKNYLQTVAKPSASISKLFQTKNKRIFVLTKGEGLFSLEGEKLVNMNKAMRIPANVLNDMAEDDRGNLWIATNEGLLKISLNGKKYGIPQLYDERHGFPSRVCDKLAIAGKTLAVSTTEGLVTFPQLDDLQPATEPGLNFEKAMVNGEPFSIVNAKLRYDKNSLLLYFNVLSYHLTRGQLLNYILEDGSSSIQQGTSGTVLSLQNLKPGNYRLKVFGQNVFGVKSSIPLIIHFTILPPFWLTWWFILLCVLSGISIFIFLFWWIKRRTERRAEIASNLKTQLAKSQLTALQAQMNPHFLFNSISSIQNFIMSNKREEAYNYLTSFSKLIRRTLNNSRSQFISLAEELETLNLYMQLEQRRYNYRFDFQINLDKDIAPENILLPPSLIQPLLENAVWHGVASINAEKRGHILLKISTKDGYLHIAVIDNGGGIQVSDSQHESLAITLIEEQLALLGRSEKNWQPRVRLEVPENGQGTAVSFNIPILQKNEDTVS